MARILVVDDDPNIRQMLRSMLEREGYEVDVASNGLECMRRFEAAPADLVITDIIMPEQEGIETIRRLRAEYPESRIIAISGGGRIGPSDYLSMAKLIGAVSTLSKPFDRKDLLEAIRGALSVA
ncbi:response regulator [bacterium]|nr:response regulator [bacterium]